VPLGKEAAPVAVTNYLMIKSLSIKNFRCFKEARIEGLRRVNIVVGRNATGKTVLLESLFLAAGGSPLVVLKLRAMRGMGDNVQIANTTLTRLWEDLFYGFNIHLPIEIDSIGTAQDSNSVFITDAGAGSLTLPMKGPGDESEASGAETEAPVSFTWRREGRPEVNTRPKLTPQGLSMENSPSPTNVIMFPANFTLNPEETSQRLSDIRKKNEIGFLLKTLKSVFPDVADVSAENNSGVWMVYISTPSVSSQMIPMALHSAGMNRLVACLLGIASAPKGIVLIDEIENGLYYKTMPDVWRAIYRFSDQYKTQVFATTHSAECLRAAQEAIKAAPGDFSLVRANLSDDERWLDLFAGEKLEGALESGFELR
jgi:hypothetical protein